MHVGTDRGSLPCKYQLQVQYPQPPEPHAQFSSRRVSREAQSRLPGVRETGSEPLSSQPRQVLQGAASGLYCSGQPHQPFGVGPWEKGGCFRDAVAGHSHGGSALCFCWIEIKLLLNVICERFKNTDAHDTFFHTCMHNFLCLKSEKMFNPVAMSCQQVSGKLFNAPQRWFLKSFLSRKVGCLCLACL